MASEASRPGQMAAGPAQPPELPKHYRPAEHEGRIRERWEGSGAFHPDPRRVLDGEALPYCIVIPPPNVTAPLHLGHALNNTLQDVLVRARRMMGFETLWMPGTDHAGIATQTVVERRLLREEGKRRTDLTRDDFIARVRALKDEYEATITEQLKRLGCSCDWARQRFTMDEQCARAVSEAFFRLFRDGLIYRGKRLVNWDPATRTALADDEVEMCEVDGHFYYLRYPIVHPLIRGEGPGVGPGGALPRIGPRGEIEDAGVDMGQALVPVTWSELRARGCPTPEGPDFADEKQAFVTVATTRPETYLGDTAVAVNPRDPRAGPLRGLLAELPLVGRIIPIIQDEYVVMPDAAAPQIGAAQDRKAQFATGFLKVTPAHDPNDYEIGLRHDLPIINIMAPDGSISDAHGWGDVGDAHIFVGRSREEARELVVKEFHARGLLEEIRPHRHAIGHSYRSHAPIEPYLSDQWYVKVTDDRMRGAALRAVVPEQRSTTASGAGVPPASTPSTDLSPAPTLPGIPDILTIHERRLPHWQKGGKTYFVTFRLLRGHLTEQERQVVLDACLHWHSERATIRLVTVMPDHVHMILTPLKREDGTWWPLQDLMHSVKSFTAHEIQKRREASGPLWQDEYYDRLVRDADEYREKWNYILGNPIKERLASKPWEYPFTRSPEYEAWLEKWKEQAAGGGAERTEEGAVEGVEGGRDARPTRSGRTAGDGALRFFPERYARTYETWHVNMRDWCISRQLWWGHRIPVWSITGTATDAAAESLTSQLENWVKDGRVAYQESAATETGNARGFFCPRPDFADAFRDYVESRGMSRDPDVLDTWFSSALWPLSTMGWPDDTELLRAFNPTSTLCTAREIITLWVSRMVMFNRCFRGQDLGIGAGNGPVPFRHVVIHPLILDGEGRKMSKSLGNGVDPLDIVGSHGADAMRFTLCHMTTHTQDVRMPVERDARTGRNTSPKFDLGRNFCTKLWNASRFALGILASPLDASSPRSIGASPLIDRWMLSRLRRAAADVDRAIAQYEYSAYAQTLYDVLWRDFCDWYLEGIKHTARADPRQRAILAHTFETLIRLLHPVLPFITEAIWERLREVETDPVDGFELGPSRADGLLATAGWPRLSGSLEDEAAEGQFSRVQALVTAIREVRAQHQVNPKRRITLHAPDGARELIALSGGVVESLAGLERVADPGIAGAAGAVAFRFESAELFLSDLAEAVDASAERQRLERQLADLDRSIRTFVGRLSNPGYTDKAPPAMVEETRQQLERSKAEHQAVVEALGRLAP